MRLNLNRGQLFRLCLRLGKPRKGTQPTTIGRVRASATATTTVLAVATCCIVNDSLVRSGLPILIHPEGQDVPPARQMAGRCGRRKHGASCSHTSAVRGVHRSLQLDPDEQRDNTLLRTRERSADFWHRPARSANAHRLRSSLWEGEERSVLALPSGRRREADEIAAKQPRQEACLRVRHEPERQLAP